MSAEVQEHRQNLQEYKSQLEQVESLLLSEPDNEEYADIHNSLTEVIQLTENLLSEALKNAQAAGPSSRPKAVVTTAPQLQLPSILPLQVANQIRWAQQKAALSGQAPPAWAIGASCTALHSDGQQYTAEVTGVTATGSFVVKFPSDESEEEVAVEHVQPPPEAQEVYQGVAAPKRKRVNEQSEVGEMPKWLVVRETDDDKTRARKKKLQKSHKSKLRFQQLDQEVKHRQDNWQNFKKGKGAKKKTGFLSAGKKASMFSVPEGVESKVGVIGSGKGMTAQPTGTKHEFSLVADGIVAGTQYL